MAINWNKIKEDHQKHFGSYLRSCIKSVYGKYHKEPIKAYNEARKKYKKFAVESHRGLRDKIETLVLTTDETLWIEFSVSKTRGISVEAGTKALTDLLSHLCIIPRKLIDEMYMAGIEIRDPHSIWVWSGLGSELLDED